MRKLAYISLLIVAFGCRKPYDPPAISGTASYLVVGGVINAGPDSTTITLSRTVNVSSANTANPVLGATVAVVSDQNVRFPLTETTNGNYVSPNLNLDVAHQYRLSIKTPNNEQYQSDLVPVGITPPIDSIGYNITNDPVLGIQIYANTHDATNTVKYYRWDYTENWEFHPKYVSYFISNGSAIVYRTQAQDVSTCYTGDISSDIVLGSSAKLSQNVLYQSPIIFIASTSEKIETEYSILLHQYALTADAYNFWLNLRTNTEALGSIFDAQPSQVQGNIHCITNPSEPVIGYISACTVTSKRVFISEDRLPLWEPTYPYQCNLDSVYTVDPHNGRPDVQLELVPLTSTLFPTNVFGPYPDPSVPPVGYLATTRPCMDCTIRGSVTPPTFWP
jgi:hypothetical protein